MKWIGQKLVYGPDGRYSWARHSALTPTPILLGDVIRVFVGFRDEKGVSRIGCVDVSAQDPSRVIHVSPEPLLDIGENGAFDDSGVILGDIVSVSGEWRMYYVGFQLVARAKFLAFTGLAIGDANCYQFRRIRRTPVLDRSEEGLFIRAIHSVRHEKGKWKAWYAAGSNWKRIDGRPYPCYEIRCSESEDGIHFPEIGLVCLKPEGDEYRIGRPRVFWDAGKYHMLFTKGDLHGAYLPGHAMSADGRDWTRDDTQVGISPSKSGWDSRTLCYPTIIDAVDKRYLFYNGNDMGRDGFGYAELSKD
jgi:hypothetical protein